MFEIKRASLIHLKPLQKLFDQYRDFYQVASAPAQSETFLRQRLTNQDSILLLAFVNQEAVGFTQIYPSFSSVAMRPLWILNDLYVDASFRQKGIAKGLMLAAEERAKSAGVFAIKLATEITNDKAISLYQSLGYQLMDQFEHYSKKIG